MKFLIHIPQLIYGGAEKVLVSFANTLVEHGHEVEVLETYEKGLLRSQFDSRVMFQAICSKEYTEKYYASLNSIFSEKNIVSKIKKCGKLFFSKVVGYKRFAEYLCAKKYTNEEYDVAINYLEIESPKFILNSIKAKKYLQWYHIDVANMSCPEETDRMIPYYLQMDKIFCVSQSAKDSLVNRYPEIKEKVEVMYNFFEKEIISTKGMEAFSFNTDKPVLLSVGRMTEQKKYLRFIEILRRLHKEGYEFQWHILGLGIQEKLIRNKIDEYALQDVVFLDGVTDNPYKYMKNCDLFVLPSGWEGFPTVTIEAKMLECPVLATDVSGIREQMKHGVNGWIVDNNEEAIYTGLKYLLDNVEVREKISGNIGMECLWDSEEKYAQFEKMINET